MRTLVIAPHPDDELLGCGGTLLRRSSEGCELGWLLITAMDEDSGWSSERVIARSDEIKKVKDGLGIPDGRFFALNYPSSHVDQIPLSTLVSKICSAVNEFQPQEILVPFPGDAHSDHRITFEAAGACMKWFRYPCVRRVMAYETPSETDIAFNPLSSAFKPNVFVEISEFLSAKLEMLEIYESELGEFPFPRSKGAIEALARVRGSQSGYKAAEAFMMLLERS